MKKALLTTVLSVLAAAVFASGNLKVNMSQAESEKAVVEATNARMELFKVEVQDEFGDVVYSKSTKTQAENYKMKYDFSALEDGTYFLNVKHGNEYYQKRFRLERGDVEVISQRKVAEPFFIQKGDKIKMSYLNFPQEETSIHVYDKSGLLHEQTLENEFAIHKAIDLSELRPGDYKIVFATGLDIFEHDVIVE
ncbi:MAG: T9SS type A sorting domain-containing protein [Tangfeifania sp.]